MAMNTVFVPSAGKLFKLGRKAPLPGKKKLRLSQFLNRASLPPPPPAVHYSPLARQSLSAVYLNDQLGDCVIAMIAHIVGVLTGNANGGKPRMFTDQEIVAMYSAIGGYVPGRPNTDQGCDERTALKYWQKYGAPNGGTKILGWLSVDPKNPVEMRQAVWLFENLLYGIPMPDSWLNNPHPGFVWDADTPDQDNGHAVSGHGYMTNGIEVCSWGMSGVITDRAHAAVVDELYVVLSPDMIDKARQKAPNGMNWEGAVRAFNDFGGDVPVPLPPPAPPPVPTPDPPPDPPSPAPSSLKDQIDAMFKVLIQLNAGNQLMVMVLQYANQLIDALLTKNRSARKKPAATAGALKDIVDGLMDKIIENEKNFFAKMALKSVKALVDQYLSSHGF